jgi:hypothetical protein
MPRDCFLPFFRSFVLHCCILVSQQELHGFYKGLSMNGADMGAWCQLFFDNLGTLLGVLIAVQDMENFGVSRGVINETVFGKIVPGVGISLLVGNVYYSWQAIRLTNKFGRQYTGKFSVY